MKKPDWNKLDRDYQQCAQEKYDSQVTYPDDESNDKTFECAWCKENGCSPSEYTRDVSELGGVDSLGNNICQECYDATLELLGDD